MLLEIGFPQESAIGMHKRVDLVSDLAFVESVAPFLANQSQRSRQIRVLEDVAFTGRASFAIKRVGSKTLRAILCRGADQTTSNTRSNR